jgi:hypothetical protein
VRFLAKVTIPKDAGDKAAKSGVLQQTVQAAMEQLKPEAAYFFDQDGDRECLFVVNLDLPAMLRPLFPGLQPSIFVTPVVSAAEFQQGLGDEESKRLFEQRSEFLADISPGASSTPEPKPSEGASAEPVPLRPRASELASKDGPP